MALGANHRSNRPPLVHHHNHFVSLTFLSFTPADSLRLALLIALALANSLHSFRNKGIALSKSPTRSVPRECRVDGIVFLVHWKYASIAAHVERPVSFVIILPFDSTAPSFLLLYILKDNLPSRFLFVNMARGGNNQSSVSGSPPPPPPPHTASHDTRGRSKKRRQRNRAFSDPRERKRPEITIVLCVFHGATRGWRTVPYTFDKYRINDEELWTDIRALYRNDLQKEWRRLLLFKRLKALLPIEVRQCCFMTQQLYSPKTVLAQRCTCTTRSEECSRSARIHALLSSPNPRQDKS